jgi:hypothetical protein
MSRKTCPHCGASVETSRTVCPTCRAALQKKSSVTPYLITGGIIAVIILVVAVLFLIPDQSSGGTPPPPITPPPTKTGAAKVTPPSCTIAISGSRAPPSSVQLRVMTNTCIAGDVAELRVLVNGEQKGTLTPGTGASGTFTGTSGSNNVIVVARFANGAESLVYQNTAL